MGHKETVQSKAKRAITHAVRDLVKERRLANDTVVVWKKGRVVRISAKRV